MRRRNNVVLLEVESGSNNLGDAITTAAVRAVIGDLLTEGASVATHSRATVNGLRTLASARLAVLGGSNILSAHMERQKLWAVGAAASGLVRGRLVLCGVGWWSYESATCAYSRNWYRTMLSRSAPHSVRDIHTQERLASVGVDSIMTGCPTTWGLPSQLAPPTGRASGVVVTVTDYAKSRTHDLAWLGELLKRYEHVAAVLMGSGDAEYLSDDLGELNIDIYGSGAEAIDRAAAEGRDYVGTRLHPGIRAIGQGMRTIILNVDNRGAEMGGDLNLPCLMRSQAAATGVPEMDDMYPRVLRVPREAIASYLDDLEKAVGELE